VIAERSKVMYSTQEWTQMQEADTADRLYRRTYIAGWLSRLGARLRGRPSALQSLESAAQSGSLRGQHFVGRETVPLAQIQGSEGRSNDFDAAFHPLAPHSRERWVSLARAWLAGANLPPIELIRIGEVYFVRDGHHRISIARAFGHQAIEAEVTAWELRPQTPPAAPAASRAVAPQGLSMTPGRPCTAQ
jgi:hypothetical protein